MAISLTPVETRILGSLVEKQTTTPDYYPMTRNALLLACNQRTNREPVMDLTEDDVARALDALHAKGLVHMVTGVGVRAAKYGQMLAPRLKLAPPQKAVLCALMLRGPQTVGEIRGRTDRTHNFADLREVEETLESLMAHPEGALVARLEREPGRKEHRYAHTLSELPERSELDGAVSPASAPERADDRISRLEDEVREMRGELAELRQTLAEFRRQFE